jgi:hypothetical protein
MLKTAEHDSDDTPPPSTTDEHPPSEVSRSETASISGQLERLQGKQRAAIERAKARQTATAHPDLEDITFGDNLPPPIKPTTPGGADSKGYDRGSLSDFSDYDSSADEAPRASTSSGRPSTSTQGRFDYKRGIDTDDYGGGDTKQGLLDDEDPFADPFADQSDVGTPGIPEKGQPKWSVIDVNDIHGKTDRFAGLYRYRHWQFIFRRKSSPDLSHVDSFIFIHFVYKFNLCV